MLAFNLIINIFFKVAYLPINPKDIDQDYQVVINVNCQSGKGGVVFVMERDFGIVLPRWVQVELAQQVFGVWGQSKNKKLLMTLPFDLNVKNKVFTLTK